MEVRWERKKKKVKQDFKIINREKPRKLIRFTASYSARVSLNKDKAVGCATNTR